MLFIIWLLVWLGRKIKASIEKRLLGTRLLKMNIFSIAVIGIISILLWQLQANQLTITIAFIFGFTWIVSKILINFWRLLLEDVDLKLYKKLRWRTIFLALLSIFIALVHIEPESNMLALSVAALDTIDTVFMLLLSLLVLPLFNLRKVMLNHLLKGIAGYWRLLISLISLLLLLAILAVPILALLGYIAMAWMVIKQLTVFFLVLAAWLIAQGILLFFTELWKESTDKESRFYEMWTKDLIPLFSKFIGLILFGLAVIAVIWGWYYNVAINSSPLFMISGQSITIGEVLISLIILWILFWLLNWFRIFTYRSIYLKIVDNGVQLDKLRTNLNIGINSRDDLEFIKGLILAELEEIPETLPRYDVWLSEITNTGVNLTIRYFVNYKQHHPQEIQSKVLFMIWDRLKKEGITQPLPQPEETS